MLLKLHMYNILKITTFIVLLNTNALAATKYIIVGVSGVGTTDSRPSMSSPAHIFENVMYNPYEQYTNLSKIFKLYHKSKPEALDPILSRFKCSQGQKKNKNLKLLILANSWGSQLAYDLAIEYYQNCGEPVEAFIVQDGIQKPSMKSFTKEIPANFCVNFFQSKAIIHGAPIEGCHNIDLTKNCKQLKSHKNGGCHTSINEILKKASFDILAKRYLKRKRIYDSKEYTEMMQSVFEKEERTLQEFYAKYRLNSKIDSIISD